MYTLVFILLSNNWGANLVSDHQIILVILWCFTFFVDNPRKTVLNIFRTMTHSLSNIDSWFVKSQYYFWLGKCRGCVCMSLNSYWSLLCWMELVSPRGLCSEAPGYSCFSYCPLSPHGSTSWCLQWGHMALMWQDEWVWTDSIFNLSPFIQQL